MATKGTFVRSGFRNGTLGLNGLILGKDSWEEGRKHNYTLHLILKGHITIVRLVNIISKVKLALFLSRRMTT